MKSNEADVPNSRGADAQRWRAGLWISAYVLLVAFPLVLVLLPGKVPPGGGWPWNFAMALGFGGLAIMGLQAVLTARFRRATGPFGADIIYYFHRLMAVAGLAFISAHYAILRIRYGDALGPLNPYSAPWHMTVGRIAFALFVALVVSSIWRKPLKIEYDRWRIGHILMAVTAVALAIAHVHGAGHRTRTGWNAYAWMGFSVFWVLVVGYVRLVRPLLLLKTPYRVTGIKRERGSSWTLTVAPEGHGGFRFLPGQFAWLTLRSSPFRAKEHPFSFSSSAADGSSVDFTIKELGDFTAKVGGVRPGEVAYVDGPHGIFTLDRFPQVKSFVFIAGGVGIAPIMSMLRTLADRGDRRTLRLVYGNRDWESVLFREEIDLLRPRLNLEVVHVLESPPAGFDGLPGVLSEDVIAQTVPSAMRSSVFFICGPKPMSDSVQRTLRRLGVPLNRIQLELFDMA